MIFLQKVKTKVFVTATMLLLSGAAMAAEGGVSGGTEAAKQAFNGITGLAKDFIAMAWPLVALLVGASVGIKLFKKFASKAS